MAQAGTQSARAATVGLGDLKTGFVRSADGTTIGYREIGEGPALVVLHGAMSSGYNHLDLARLLADRYRIILVDRRGRGLSGPHRADHGLDTEVEDLAAVLDAAHAERVFGVSSGAIIALATASRRPSLRKVAAFEPPLFPDDRLPRKIFGRFERELAEGKVAAALVTAMRGAEMGPPFMRRAPRPLVELLTRLMLTMQRRGRGGGYVPMGVLAPALRHDLALSAAASGRASGLVPASAEVLLLGGSESPAYLRAALDIVGEVLPAARRVELAGVDHAASWNTDRGGHPKPVAAALREFFA